MMVMRSPGPTPRLILSEIPAQASAKSLAAAGQLAQSSDVNKG
jgi:hypothetical protein